MKRKPHLLLDCDWRTWGIAIALRIAEPGDWDTTVFAVAIGPFEIGIEWRYPSDDIR
jgi:hypothetical protein